MEPWSAAYRAEMGLALIGGIARGVLMAFMDGQLAVVLGIADESFRGGARDRQSAQEGEKISGGSL